MITWALIILMAQNHSMVVPGFTSEDACWRARRAVDASSPMGTRTVCVEVK